MDTQHDDAGKIEAGEITLTAEDIVVERGLSQTRAINAPKFAAKNGQNQQNYQNN